MRDLIAAVLDEQTKTFLANDLFIGLEQGKASRQAYDDFLANILVAHLNSPKFMAFLYAISPPATSEEVRRNLLEEMGFEEAGASHPALLMEAVKAAGFDDLRIGKLTEKAQKQIHQNLSAPFPFATFKEFGLSLMLEIFSFEWMLARAAHRIGDMFHLHRDMDRKALVWFYFHAQKDLEHAEEALDTLEAFTAYYGIDKAIFSKIAAMTFAENVFIKRYLAGIVV